MSDPEIRVTGLQNDGLRYYWPTCSIIFNDFDICDRASIGFGRFLQSLKRSKALAGSMGPLKINS